MVLKRKKFREKHGKRLIHYKPSTNSRRRLIGYYLESHVRKDGKVLLPVYLLQPIKAYCMAINGCVEAKPNGVRTTSSEAMRNETENTYLWDQIRTVRVVDEFNKSHCFFGVKTEFSCTLRVKVRCTTFTLINARIKFPFPARIRGKVIYRQRRWRECLVRIT